MKNKLGATVLLSLLYAQGLLGVAAVAAVLMKEPAKQHRGRRSRRQSKAWFRSSKWRLVR